MNPWLAFALGLAAPALAFVVLCVVTGRPPPAPELGGKAQAVERPGVTALLRYLRQRTA